MTAEQYPRACRHGMWATTCALCRADGEGLFYRTEAQLRADERLIKLPYALAPLPMPCRGGCERRIFAGSATFLVEGSWVCRDCAERYCRQD